MAIPGGGVQIPVNLILPGYVQDLQKAEVLTIASTNRWKQNVEAIASNTTPKLDKWDKEWIRARALVELEAKKMRKAVEDEMKALDPTFNDTRIKFGKVFQFAAVAGGAGIFGIAGLVNKAVQGITENTVQAEQAQFALNQVYKDATPIFNQFAESFGKEIGKTTAEIQQALVAGRSLANNYGFTNEQIKILVKTSADLAAISGTTVPEAMKRVEAAMRGEAESAEYLGQTLNSDAIKAMAKMTDEERKHFEQLDRVTKGQIVMNALMDQSASTQGAAAAKTETNIGKIDKLGTTMGELGATVGKIAVPAIAEMAVGLTSMAEAAGIAVKGIDDLLKVADQDALKNLGKFLLGAGPAFTGVGAILAGAGARPQDKKLGPEDEDVANAAALRQEAESTAKAFEDQARGQAKLRTTEYLKEQAETIERIADETIDAIEAEIKATEKQYDRNKTILEAERADKLETVEANKRAAIDALEEEHLAKQDANKRASALLQAERDEKLKAADDKRKAALEAIEDERQAAEEAIEDSIAETQRARDIAKQASKDKRDTAIRLIDEEAKASDRSFDNRIAKAQQLRDREIDSINAAMQADLSALEKRSRAAEKSFERRTAQEQRAKELAIRAADDRREAALAAIENETSGKRAAVDKEISDIERVKETRKQAAEDVRDTALKAIEAEKAAREKQRTIEDRQLEDSHKLQQAGIEDRRDLAIRALEDEQEKFDDVHELRLRHLDAELEAADDVRDLEKRRIDELIDREKERHDRVVRNLEDEERRELGTIDLQLKELAKQERKADQSQRQAKLEGVLKEAQQALTEAEAHGSVVDILEARKDIAAAEEAIRQESLDQERETFKIALEEKRDALEQGFTDSKNLANDEHKLRVENLNKEKEAQDEIYKAVADRVDKEKQAIQDIVKANSEALAQRKAAITDAYNDDIEKFRALVEEQKRAIEDRRATENESYDLRVQTVRRAYEDEQDAIRKTYDDATAGAIPKLKEQAKVAQEEYERRKKAVADAYEDEQRKIKDTYDDPVNGVFAKLRRQAQESKDKYDDRKRSITDSYKAEQDAVKKTYDDPVDGVLAKLRSQARDAKEHYDARRDIVRATYDDEQRKFTELYDDPVHGLLAKLREQKEQTQIEYGNRRDIVNKEYQAEIDKYKEVYDHPVTGLLKKIEEQREATEREYARSREAVTREFEEKKKAVQNFYSNPGKTGALDLLEKHKNDTIETLRESKSAWVDWKIEAAKQIKEVQQDIDKFIRSLEKLDEFGAIDFIPATPGEPRARPPRGGGAAYGPVVRNASADSYWTSGGTHGGFPAADIFAERGEPILAPVSGSLRAFLVSKGGNAAILQGDDGRSYYFAHGDVPFKQGKVDQGEHIGRVGSSGNAEGTRPHVHFAISTQGPGLFGERNGSGDVSGDASYWGEGGTHDASQQGADLVLQLFRRTIRIALREPQGMDLVRSIERLGEGIGGKEFGRAAAAIALSEGADSDLTRPGTGGARGPFQFDPGGQLQNYARHLGVSMAEAGDFAGRHPMSAAKWALEGYLGAAIKRGQREGYYGYQLANYGSRFGQKPYEDEFVQYWRRAGKAHLDLYGYASGGNILEPTLLVGLRSGPYGIAGESGRERLLSNADTLSYESSGLQSAKINVQLGDEILSTLYVKGRQLAISQGRDSFAKIG